MRKRSFLFLQGVCSPFFPRLAARLASDGHRVCRINFNGGDAAYWNGLPSWSFRDNVESLREFLADKFVSLRTTDVVLFGDRRPVHRAAIDLAKCMGIRVHVYEEGYFRPYWITLERDGVNAHSRLPRDPAWYLRVGRNLPHYDDGKPFASPFSMRALHDVNYHVACAISPVFFPGYRTHAPCVAPVEYCGFVLRRAKRRFCGNRERAMEKRLISERIPFFLLPLQLDGDAQIRDHSQFCNMSGVIGVVMQSFAAHCGEDAHLVIKNHPLDSGFDDHALLVRKLEHQYGLSGRIHYFEDGDLPVLVQNARGVVTVNSTVGGISLHYDCPTIALSRPIYDIPGLTFQGGLDDFWQNSTPPDRELFHFFRNTVIHTTQINGGFYSREAINMAVCNSIHTLTADKSPLEELL